MANKRGAPKKPERGYGARTFWGTRDELELAKRFIRRARRRIATLTLLGELRRRGIGVELKGTEIELDIPEGAFTEEERRKFIDEIRAGKDVLLATLRAEAWTGQQWADSGLLAGIERTYGQCANLYDQGTARAPIMALVGIMDELMFLSLPDAMSSYLAKKPEMESIVAQINRERSESKSGPELFKALESAGMSTKPKKKESINAAGLL